MDLRSGSNPDRNPPQPPPAPAKPDAAPAKPAEAPGKHPPVAEAPGKHPPALAKEPPAHVHAQQDDGLPPGPGPNIVDAGTILQLFQASQAASMQAFTQQLQASAAAQQQQFDQQLAQMQANHDAQRQAQQGHIDALSAAVLASSTQVQGAVQAMTHTIANPPAPPPPPVRPQQVRAPPIPPK